ncbi:hypothetical protein CMQ_4060 [Grosmannia clavigera kw1407]|uniref:Uncharacterized protein n=1 Tax=Grosmannia clavigera (strain kw1407 / UAMH 11150) TaxID=655863 RepID=F0XAF1_GROCL|nr:uncharacterized protein CMQ_4060 [Grosmannia clavigera kw1407]EFX05991.1 hypothetical protein CMQ_4060 [Grosmannia clavigera kw1407]
MPKRRHWAKYSKPQTTAPHSLESSGLQSNLHHEEPQTRNVNDLLASLRKASLAPSIAGTGHGSGSGDTGSAGNGLTPPAAHAIVAPSVPPDIARILLPGMPAAAPAAQANGGGIAAAGTQAAGIAGGVGGRQRAPAGPAPPPSWLSQSRHAPRRIQADTQKYHTPRGISMPGISTPSHRSLVSIVVRKIAIEWAFQRHFNQYYLPYLHGALKAAVVSCLSARADAGQGVTVADLRTLFLLPQPFTAQNRSEDAEADGRNGDWDDGSLPSPTLSNEDVHYLDLALSIGRSIQLKELSDLLFPLGMGRSSAAAKKRASLDLQESWDSAGETSLPRSLLPNLTHLSLAQSPGSIRSQVNWRQLLAFAAHIPTLTHLSLAYWPEPTLTPNAKFVTVISHVGERRVQYGGTGPYSHSLDDDWAEAILVVRKLSKALYGLEYLDLTGCASWIPALMHRADHDAVDWVGDWGKVTTLVLCYGSACGDGYGGVASTEHLPGEVARQVNAASELKATRIRSLVDSPQVLASDGCWSPHRLGLFAGNTPGFMEDYQVIMVRENPPFLALPDVDRLLLQLNTSVLGRNYVPQLYLATAGASRALREKRDPGHGHNSSDSDYDYDVVNGTAADRLRAREMTLAAAENEIAGLTYAEAANRMTVLLGISEFYTLHVMNSCEGSFSPNVTAPNNWRNVTNCTSQIAIPQLNLSGIIDGELQAGFTGDSGLLALGASRSLAGALNRIPTIGMAIAVFYIVGVGAAGLGLLTSAIALVTLASHPRETLLAGLGTTSGAAMALLIAAVVAVVAAGSTVDSINRLGKDTIGMEAVRGTAFCNLTWAAFVFNGLAAVYWAYRLHQDARAAAAAAAAKNKADAAAEAEPKP